MLARRGVVRIIAPIDNLREHQPFCSIPDHVHTTTQLEETDMTKAELVAQMAESAGIGRSVAEKALNGFISTVSDALAGNEKITLVGFGTFDIAARAQREGRNPRTGEAITIPSSKAVRFKAGNRLKEALK
jgi:DNA-binding protein HU-beta